MSGRVWISDAERPRLLEAFHALMTILLAIGARLLAESVFGGGGALSEGEEPSRPQLTADRGADRDAPIARERPAGETQIDLARLPSAPMRRLGGKEPMG